MLCGVLVTNKKKTAYWKIRVDIFDKIINDGDVFSACPWAARRRYDDVGVWLC